VTSPADALPDYAPVPESSRGAALTDQGYYVGRVERNLYWVTDGVYNSALMLIDIVNAGWVPIYNTNLSEDVPGYMGAPAIALDYPWRHLNSGHLSRLATRDDVALHQRYIADIEASAREAPAAVDPVPLSMHYGENVWAGIRAHLNAVTDRAAAPVIAKYTGVLAAADVAEYTWTTTFAIMQSLRLDYGPSGPVHP
jgi:hypothetical protein